MMSSDEGGVFPPLGHVRAEVLLVLSPSTFDGARLQLIDTGATASRLIEEEIASSSGPDGRCLMNSQHAAIEYPNRISVYNLVIQ